MSLIENVVLFMATVATITLSSILRTEMQCLIANRKFTIHMTLYSFQKIIKIQMRPFLLNVGYAFIFTNFVTPALDLS